jgi:hypothetical protein
LRSGIGQQRPHFVAVAAKLCRRFTCFLAGRPNISAIFTAPLPVPGANEPIPARRVLDLDVAGAWRLCGAKATSWRFWGGPID